MELNQPLISVITVSYNAASTIESTILSVIQQTFDNFEYLIIDGGSTDGTIDIINKHIDKISYLLTEADNGIYDAMNKGIKVARGKFIYFIGADDVLINNNILNIVSTCLEDENNIYYGNVLFKKRNVIYDGRFTSLKIVTRNISHQSIFYPSRLFVKVKFNTRYRVFADYDLNLRLFNSYKFIYIPITVAIFNDQGASGIGTFDVAFENDRIKIIKDHFPYWVYFYRRLRSKLAYFGSHE